MNARRTRPHRLPRLTTLATASALSCASASPGGPADAPAVAIAHSSHSAPDTTSKPWAPGNYVINLYDAFGPDTPGLTHDFGFSALVRYQGQTILFDGGSNADVLKSNCERLGIDLRDVDVAVASHAHFDHINGFDYLLEVNPEVKIYFPKDMFWGANVEFDLSGAEPDIADSLPADQRYFRGEREGYVFNQSGRFWGANIEFISENTEILPGVTLVATRSPFMGYFSRYPTPGEDHGHAHDPAIKTNELPELSMSLRTKTGEVLLVGCSHSLVETIVRETKQHLGRPLDLVYGGYHLLPYDSTAVRAIARRMKDELGVRQVAPAHCTGHVGFSVFREVYGDDYRLAGLGTQIELSPADERVARPTVGGLAGSTKGPTPM
jgi:7,8-dihydropterin-6-yl-methyl-4-(beta-D-ribofuranosyl)aminobenzene 5'-phosphate synthase